MSDDIYDDDGQEAAPMDMLASYFAAHDWAHEMVGEDEIVAFVVPKPGSAVDPEVLRAFVRERLADHKVPARIHVRSSLPRTATERVAKHLLSET